MSSLLRAASPPSPVETALSPQNPCVLVIAHRGVFDRAPENSVAALERAVALGVDMMELDTQANRDGTLLVVHDDTLERTTTGGGPVAASSDADRGRLRLRAGEGGGDAPATDHPLPTLAEMLEAARGRILLNIDTKHPRDLPAVGRLVLDMGMEGEVIVKAEVDPSAPRWPAEDFPFFGQIPFMPVFKLQSGRAKAQVEAVARIAPAMIECHFDSLAALHEARGAREAAGIRHWANSLDCSHSLDFSDSRAAEDPEAVWGALLDTGCGAIQTDRAEALIAWLGTRHRSAAR
ncbi:glycerophosphodiester phosphodiesterase family protein [Aureimonas psammosilenae]|uniref:glycerophosphodiester phosphodiesterase family protein n=1 Tax=Aureimonas psammosilenae TaxID=2495496 RepID=UPI00186A0BB4|nr:glycerophosphodiester phosphodiesterase family protein [Aureimonas psammosilenae]